MLGEWSDKIHAFWCGVNGLEHIAWRGSYNIFVYGSGQLPVCIIRYDKQIRTLKDFDDAMNNGERLNADFTPIEVLPKAIESTESA